MFIDGDKREYPDYYRMLMGDGGGKALLRSGSILIADNILWSGKVVEPVAHNDRHTQSLLEIGQPSADKGRAGKGRKENPASKRTADRQREKTAL